jgi:hypothetical protein
MTALFVRTSTITATPPKVFIGDLASGANRTVPVAITPDQPTTLDITVQYSNGNNIHRETVELPIVFGTDKKQANPVISNVQVKSEGGTYHITGDVTNAGLETAVHCRESQGLGRPCPCHLGDLIKRELPVNPCDIRGSDNLVAVLENVSQCSDISRDGAVT